MFSLPFIGRGATAATGALLSLNESRILRKVGGALVSSFLRKNWRDPPFNARGDGVTDDTAAIQAALAAGVGYADDGATYLTSDTIDVPSGITVSGFQTVVRCTAANKPALRCVSTTRTVIRDIEIQAPNGTGIQLLHGCNFCKVLGVWVTQYADKGVELYSQYAAPEWNEIEARIDQGPHGIPDMDSQTAVSVLGLQLYLKLRLWINYSGHGLWIDDSLPGGSPGYKSQAPDIVIFLMNGIARSAGDGTALRVNAQAPTVRMKLETPAVQVALDSRGSENLRIDSVFDGCEPWPEATPIPAPPHNPLVLVSPTIPGLASGRNTILGASDGGSGVYQSQLSPTIVTIQQQYGPDWKNQPDMVVNAAHQRIVMNGVLGRSVALSADTDGRSIASVWYGSSGLNFTNWEIYLVNAGDTDLDIEHESLLEGVPGGRILTATGQTVTLFARPGYPPAWVRLRRHAGYDRWVADTPVNNALVYPYMGQWGANGGGYWDPGAMQLLAGNWVSREGAKLWMVAGGAGTTTRNTALFTGGRQAILSAGGKYFEGASLISTWSAPNVGKPCSMHMHFVTPVQGTTLKGVWHINNNTDTAVLYGSFSNGSGANINAYSDYCSGTFYDYYVASTFGVEYVFSWFFGLTEWQMFVNGAPQPAHGPYVRGEPDGIGAANVRVGASLGGSAVQDLAVRRIAMQSATDYAQRAAIHATLCSSWLGR
jgi:hypothetical protein